MPGTIRVNDGRYSPIFDGIPFSLLPDTMEHCARTNNDGQNDLFVTNYDVNQIWCNYGDRHFESVTGTDDLGGIDWSSSDDFVDINDDGGSNNYGAVDILLTNNNESAPVLL